MQQDRILELVELLREKGKLFADSLQMQIQRCQQIAEDNLRIVQAKCLDLQCEVEGQLDRMNVVQQEVASLNALLVEMTGYLQDL